MELMKCQVRMSQLLWFVYSRISIVNGDRRQHSEFGRNFMSFFAFFLWTEMNWFKKTIFNPRNFLDKFPVNFDWFPSKYPHYPFRLKHFSVYCERSRNSYESSTEVVVSDGVCISLEMEWRFVVKLRMTLTMNSITTRGDISQALLTLNALVW